MGIIVLSKGFQNIYLKKSLNEPNKFLLYLKAKRGLVGLSFVDVLRRQIIWGDKIMTFPSICILKCV